MYIDADDPNYHGLVVEYVTGSTHDFTVQFTNGVKLTIEPDFAYDDTSKYPVLKINGDESYKW